MIFGRLSRHKQQLKKAGLLCLLYISLPVFLMNTNPEALPLAMLLIPFALLFVCLFATVLMIGSHTVFLRGMSRRRQYILAGFIAVVPMLLAIFQSMQQLTIRDVAIAAALVIAAIFYISRADFLR